MKICFVHEEYPKETGGIDDPKYSIDTGVHFLADCLKLSEVSEVYDLKKYPWQSKDIIMERIILTGH